MTHGPEKSDPVIVAGKPTNKAERSAAELVEPRTGTKGNADRQSTHWTQSQARVSQELERIRQAVAVTHPRWEPHAGKPHVRICAGGARQLASLPLKRREFIAGLGGAAALPRWARAQPRPLVIGFLFPFTVMSPVMQPYLAAFRQGLQEGGFVEGQNVAIEYRTADGHLDQLPSLAADLVSTHPAVIVAAQLPAALAAKAATNTVPLVFTAGDDPVRTGLVAAINRPGGNATGVNPIVTSLDDKRLALLKELVPSTKQIAVLLNPKSPDVAVHIANLRAASRLLEVELSVVHASKECRF